MNQLKLSNIELFYKEVEVFQAQQREMTVGVMKPSMHYPNYFDYISKNSQWAGITMSHGHEPTGVVASFSFISAGVEVTQPPEIELNRAVLDISGWLEIVNLAEVEPVKAERQIMIDGIITSEDITEEAIVAVRAIRSFKQLEPSSFS